MDTGPFADRNQFGRLEKGPGTGQRDPFGKMEDAVGVGVTAQHPVAHLAGGLADAGGSVES